jgi:hypothetical protein
MCVHRNAHASAQAAALCMGSPCGCFNPEYIRWAMVPQQQLTAKRKCAIASGCTGARDFRGRSWGGGVQEETPSGHNRLSLLQHEQAIVRGHMCTCHAIVCHRMYRPSCVGTCVHARESHRMHRPLLEGKCVHARALSSPTQPQHQDGSLRPSGS